MSNKIYFIFSSEQYKIKEEANKRIGRIYKPRWVMVNGKKRQFTEMVKDPNRMTYSDGIVVASGDKDKMVYR